MECGAIMMLTGWVCKGPLMRRHIGSARTMVITGRQCGKSIQHLPTRTRTRLVMPDDWIVVWCCSARVGSLTTLVP
jgi:hypothetical protein